MIKKTIDSFEYKCLFIILHTITVAMIIYVVLTNPYTKVENVTIKEVLSEYNNALVNRELETVDNLLKDNMGVQSDKLKDDTYKVALNKLYDSLLTSEVSYTTGSDKSATMILSFNTYTTPSKIEYSTEELYEICEGYISDSSNNELYIERLKIFYLKTLSNNFILDSTSTSTTYKYEVNLSDDNKLYNMNTVLTQLFNQMGITKILKLYESSFIKEVESVIYSYKSLEKRP